MTTSRCTIGLKPLDISFEVERGTPLQDVLFDYGVEFPCGGRQRCRGCKVRVLGGELPATAEQAALLTAAELAAGWRLACSGAATGDMVLELAQWEAAILSDNSAFRFIPREGFGIAIDTGTTTIVGQVLDLSNGNVVAVETALNVQARHGADIMERINVEMSSEKAEGLGFALRDQIQAIVMALLERADVPADRLHEIVLVGNAVMQHFFCGFDIEPLARVPFEPEAAAMETRTFSPRDLGWSLSASTRIRFLPSIGGFVGSDVLAGILATGIYRRKAYSCLIDLGTNGEIVIGNRNGLVCASSAAGPAFEGARISMGMRAATGAIAGVMEENGAVRCSVIGGGAARGICGSGLVDAVAVGLRAGRIQASGRLSQPESMSGMLGPVRITQKDIRELQLAKGAIAAGVYILLEESGLQPDDVTRIYLAGAFGNYISRESARQIGLVPFSVRRIRPAGNTALIGAKMALFAESEPLVAAVRRMTRHRALGSSARFMEVFAREMGFPGRE
jgi:uncharacterized 2Fe-2S/4Fe-4S cluster protein (DUF4445 family)